jgi:hypothetical protein
MLAIDSVGALSGRFAMLSIKPGFTRAVCRMLRLWW